MFVVIYRFTIYPEKTNEFIDAWQQLTKLIKTHEGSLGSRLHKHTEQEYIGYAQWPDEHTFTTSSSQLPEKADLLRQTMRSACHNIEILYKMETVVDELI